MFHSIADRVGASKSFQQPGSQVHPLTGKLTKHETLESEALESPQPVPRNEVADVLKRLEIHLLNTVQSTGRNTVQSTGRNTQTLCDVLHDTHTLEPSKGPCMLLSGLLTALVHLVYVSNVLKHPIS